MAQPSLCPTCGAVIPYGAPAGQCVKCLLGLAVPLEDERHDNSDHGGFGDFEFLNEGKAGGMGIVYHARQRSLNRLVALKLIRAGFLEAPSSRVRFRAEAEAAASLDHPNIVPIYEIGEFEGQPYFTMKWAAGGSLADKLTKGEWPPQEPQTDNAPAAAAKLVAKIARAVSHAHQRGILHRDLKPDNVLLDAAGEPLVTDFGLAKWLNGTKDLTVSGAIMGTPGYMSPEQARGKTKQTTIASDVFSLGAILYHLLTGRPPFTGENTVEIIRKVLEQEPVRPRTINPRLPADLETICLRCLEKEPLKRYASALAVAEDLENWLKGEPISARPVSDWERAWKWARRHPAVAGLSGAVALSLLLGLAGVTWQWQQAKRARDRTALVNTRLQMQRAEELFDTAQPHLGLATLARMLRDAPQNRVAAERLLNALTWQVFLVPVGAETNGFAAPMDVSPDGKLRAVLTGAGKDSFRVETVGGSNLVLQVSPAHLGPIRGFNFSPDSRLLVTASSDKTAKLWDAQTGTNLLRLAHGQGVNWAEFSPDGTRLATATEGWRAEAQLWDAADGQRLGAPMSHRNAINTVHFSGDGRRLVTASDDRTVRLWDARTGAGLSVPATSPAAVDDARFFTDDAHILVFSAGKVRNFGLTQPARWEKAEGMEAPKPGDAIAGSASALRSQLAPKHADVITCVALSPNGRVVATTSKDKTARLWNAVTLQPLTGPLVHEDIVNCVRFSPDGLRLVTSTARPGQSVRVWEVETGEPLTDRIHSDAVVAAVTFSPDGCWLISSAQQKWRFWLVSQPVPAWVPELAEALAGVRYRPDGIDEPIAPDPGFQLRPRLLEVGQHKDIAPWEKAFLGTLGIEPP